MSEPNPVPCHTPSDAVFAERRTRVRYMAALEASCRRTGDANGQTCPGRVVNISMGGIGLLLRRRFQAETLLDIELKGSTGWALRILQVRVIHSTPFKDEDTPGWLLGCAFAKELPEDELWPLLCYDGTAGK